MNILIITDYLPFPLISGDRIRVYNLIKNLSSNHEVSLLSLTRPDDSLIAIEHLSKYCQYIGLAELNKKSKIGYIPEIIRFLLMRTPIELSFLSSKKMEEEIKTITRNNQFDVIQYEHSRMAFYDKYVDKHQQAQRVIMFHNVIFVQSESIYKINENKLDRFRDRLFSRQMKKWETDYSSRFDRCITVSKKDRQHLVSANPELKVDVVANGVDTDTLQPLPLEDKSPSLLFVGSMGYLPVANASIYFCNQILPLIKEKYPDITVWLVGREPTTEVKNLESKNIHVTGQVESVLEYYKKSTICIVPLKAGGGTRLKILEAMALGRPVVSTSIGCEGLNVIDNKHLLIADSPDDFSEKVISLIENDSLRQRIILEARKLVEKDYNWRKLTNRLESIYEDVISN